MTNTVSFPGLGLEFTLNRVAAAPFGFNIYWYAVIIVSGAILAWFYCSRKGPKLGISDDDLTDLLIFAVPLALVGARLYYILFYLDLFKNEDGSLNFGKMLDVRDGGLAIYGGVIAAVIVLFFVCRYKKIPFLAFADLGGMGLLIGQCIGRWGNFVNVEAYGGLTDLPWRMCSEKIANELYAKGLVDAAGWQQVVDGTLGVHPTFFYESAWNLVGFLLIVFISRNWRKFDGQLFFTYLAWYGVGRGIIEGMRTDSLYFMNTPIRVSQVLGFASALAAIILWVWFYLHRPEPDQLWVHRRAALEAAKAANEKKEDEAMAATIIDGKALAAKCKARIKEEVEHLSKRPGLAVIIVGDNPASRIYVNHKKKDCAECGIYSEEYALPECARQEELLELIDLLNGREDIDGILVQLPLPAQFDEKAVLNAIDPGKDVDCFHPYNVGQLMIGEHTFLPCTPAGVMAMLDEYGIDPAGKHAVVVGRSNIVGKPQAMLLLQRHATVTICHSRTPNLAEITRQADILVAAVGKTGLITADMVKEGAAVIDVAMNRNEEGKLCGDVDFEAVKEKASFITPVPGGVGPMTRVMLLENTLTAAKVHGK